MGGDARQCVDDEVFSMMTLLIFSTNIAFVQAFFTRFLPSGERYLPLHTGNYRMVENPLVVGG